MQMYRILYRKAIAGVLCLSLSFPALADEGKAGIRVTDPKLVKNDAVMSVSMHIDFPGLKVKSTGATVLTPMIVNGTDTLKLPPLGIYGRTSWYMSQRNDRMPADASEEHILRYEKNLGSVSYSQHVDYADWMNGSELIVERADYGCAGCSEGSEVSELARYKNVVYQPTLVYQKAIAEPVKRRALEGKSFVDFPVDQTVIYPEYRNNTRELERIRATIDTVRNDPDATIDSVWLKGWASPESPYSHNTDLAIGRTRALKQYIQRMYNFTGVAMLTDYEPENWIGLRRFVEDSNLEHRSEILAMIDLDMDPDAKEAKIKRTYPEEYRFMLQTYYPALRRTDYRVSYHIRQFTDPWEILKVMREHPQKLSLSEFYAAASVLEPGSSEYMDVFETAVRMYPSDGVANLNAANAAMQRSDLSSAARYLDKAGDSAEAVYARGVLSALQGDYDKALEIMEQAARKGMDTTPMREHLMEVKKYR